MLPIISRLCMPVQPLANVAPFSVLFNLTFNLQRSSVPCIQSMVFTCLPSNQVYFHLALSRLPLFCRLLTIKWLNFYSSPIILISLTLYFASHQLCQLDHFPRGPFCNSKHCHSIQNFSISLNRFEAVHHFYCYQNFICAKLGKRAGEAYCRAPSVFGTYCYSLQRLYLILLLLSFTHQLTTIGNLPACSFLSTRQHHQRLHHYCR